VPPQAGTRSSEPTDLLDFLPAFLLLILSAAIALFASPQPATVRSGRDHHCALGEGDGQTARARECVVEVAQGVDIGP
jgi:hypothetical protein